jgi:DNA modification methylase
MIAFMLVSRRRSWDGGKTLSKYSHLVVIGNSKNMRDFVEDESIHLIITSPPYWNLKQYGGEESGFFQAYLQYIDDISRVLHECKRVLKRGRFLCINVGTAVSNEEMKSIPADIIQVMAKLDFIFRKEIIWEKPKGTQGLWQRGTTKFLKRFPYPGYLNINIMHEYILIFQKKGEFDIPIEALEKHKLPESFIKQVAWSVWPMRVSMTKGHPAPFPEELPERLMKLYSIEGETVLDPFGGTGTVAKVARDLDRNSVTYEVNAKYLELMKKKIGWGQQTLGKEHQYNIQFQKGAHEGVLTNAEKPLLIEQRQSP